MPADESKPTIHRFRRRAHRLLGVTRWMAGQKTTREEAVTEIARRYRKFVEIFERAPGS